MDVTSEMSQMWANQLHQLHEKLADRDNTDHNVWIVQALFCAMRYLKSLEVPSQGRVPVVETLKNVCRNDGDFYQTHSPDGLADFQYN